MNAQPVNLKKQAWPVLQNFPLPAKALATAIIAVMAIGMAGALGQIIVHDIIPTFFSSPQAADHTGHSQSAPPLVRLEFFRGNAGKPWGPFFSCRTRRTGPFQ